MNKLLMVAAGLGLLLLLRGKSRSHGSLGEDSTEDLKKRIAALEAALNQPETPLVLVPDTEVYYAPLYGGPSWLGPAWGGRGWHGGHRRHR